MPRIRSIKPEFYSDPDLGRLSLEARYLYVSLWVFADDEGRLPGDPRLIRSQTFPFDDKVTVRKVTTLLAELEDAHKIVPYEVAGIHYLLLRNFRTHQRIDKPQPSRYPSPPLSLFDDSENVPGMNGERSSPYRKGRDTKDTKGEGEERARARAIEDWKPSEPLIEWAIEKYPSVDLLSETQKFIDHFTANGKPMKDWDAAWRNWIRRSVEFARSSR